jgi:hypothetical protein
MSGLFISYRRDDQAGFAGRLADALESAFGADSVFRDVQDIRPGEDFVVALHAQLQSVDVMLVMIGPAWLTVSRNGVRRLDEADDFVRHEIQAGLESGKPVLPVLVGGAAMPTEDDLPAAIGALARRQAFVLSDAGWSSDMARLVEDIGHFLPRPWRLGWRSGVAASALIVLLALGLNGYWLPPPPPPPDAASADIADTLSGRWTAQVKYDWGDSHDERFDLQLENGEVRGTATYLRVARTIEQGEWRDGRLRFVTHTQEVLGDASREVSHRYRALWTSGELHFVLESSGGHSPHPQVEFVARRPAP